MPISGPQANDLSSPEDTEALARRVAPRLCPGDTLLLEGPIGAGKTHFARALIKSRLLQHGLYEDVPSPTFTLVQTYEAGDTEIWHADLYRLANPTDADELALEEAFERAICLIEWPDRLGAAAPSSAVRLGFEILGDKRRRITVRSGSGRWRELTCADPESRGAE